MASPYHGQCGGTSFFLILYECTATSSGLSLCKLFANTCVNQDVSYMNRLVATPNNWRRMNPGTLDAVVQCIYCGREYGVISSLCILEGGNGLQEKEGI